MVLSNDDIEPSVRGGSVDIGRQLALSSDEACGLAESRIEPARRIARTSCGVGLTFIELAAIGRVGDPDAAVRMGDDVVGGVETLWTACGRR